MAQGRLSGLGDALFRAAHLGQEVDGVLDDVLNRQRDIHDVLVLGEHERLMLVVAHEVNVDDAHFIDDRWVPVQARQNDVVLHGAEAKHDAVLALIDLVEAEDHVDNSQDHQAADQAALADTAAARSAVVTAASEHARQLRLQLLEGLVQVRRALIAAATPGVVLFAAPATARFVPSHVRLDPM